MGWIRKDLQFDLWHGYENFLLVSVQTGTGAYPASYSVGTSAFSSPLSWCCS